MKNDFKQLVDQNLSGLRWDERRQARVLRALEPEGGTSMKRKMTMAIALAAALVMMASVAVAAVVLTYSPSASVLKQARDAVVPDDRHVDLSQAVIADLVSIGVDPARICDCGICTKCNDDEYFSYRAENGTCGRHGAVAIRLKG